MNCPKCSAQLNRKTIESLNIESCPSCEGVWLDKFEVKKLVNIDENKILKSGISATLKKDKNIAEKNSSDILICPYCSSKMDTINYNFISDIKIDICQSCLGTWLDDGELKDIINFNNTKNGSLSESKIQEMKSQLEKSGYDIKKTGVGELLQVYLKSIFKLVYEKKYDAF